LLDLTTKRNPPAAACTNCSQSFRVHFR
jgi:hypothetical protein